MSEGGLEIFDPMGGEEIEKRQKERKRIMLRDIEIQRLYKEYNDVLQRSKNTIARIEREEKEKVGQQFVQGVRDFLNLADDRQKALKIAKDEVEEISQNVDDLKSVKDIKNRRLFIIKTLAGAITALTLIIGSLSAYGIYRAVKRNETRNGIVNK